MKKILTMAVCFIILNTAFGQWVYKEVNNGFDDSYKIAYSINSETQAILKMEKTKNDISLYITGGYFCNEVLLVDVSLKIGDEFHKYKFKCFKSRDSKTVFILDDLLSEKRKDFLDNFNISNFILIRVNETYCSTSYFTFDMTNSQNAVNFLKN